MGAKRTGHHVARESQGGRAERLPLLFRVDISGRKPQACAPPKRAGSDPFLGPPLQK